MLDNPILELNLSARTEFCLKRAKIFTLHDLCFRSEQDLRNIKYLGSKAIQEIVEKLNSKGLKLDKDPSGYSRFQKLKICEDPLFPDYDYNIRSFLTLPQTILDELKEIGLSSNWALILEQPTLEKREEMWYKLEGHKEIYERRPRTVKLFQMLGPLVAERDAINEVVKRRPEVKYIIDTDIRDIEEAREYARLSVENIRGWEQIDLNYLLNGSKLMRRREDKGNIVLLLDKVE